MKEDIEQWLLDDANATAADIDATEEALIRFANAHAARPSPGVREKILNKLSKLSAEKANKTDFPKEGWPLLNEESNWLSWQEAVKHIAPPENYEGIHLHVLESTPHRDLFIAWVKEYVEEEVHHDLLESFILLEGTCECHITDQEGNSRIVRMTAGDYIRMELGETHDVVITSLQPAKAILQWEKLRA